MTQERKIRATHPKTGVRWDSDQLFKENVAHKGKLNAQKHLTNT